MDFLVSLLEIHAAIYRHKRNPYPGCPLLSLLTAILKRWNQPGCPQHWHNFRPPDVSKDSAFNTVPLLIDINIKHPKLSYSSPSSFKTS